MPTRALKSLFAFAFLLLGSSTASAQYTPAAGQNAPMESVRVQTVDDDTGRIVEKQVQRAPRRDGYGNAQGNQYDLAIDGAFEGQTIAVLHFYTAFDFSLPTAALREKGFSVYRWVGTAPPPAELQAGLEKSCQLWIISDATRKLTPEHIAIIRRFFESGRGVYIWGDNEPFYADANAVAEALFGGKMLGDLHGDRVVGVQREPGQPGVLANHLLTTGLEHLYEGITIATIQPNPKLKPLVYGSAGNLVAAVYEHDGKRAILDGGFTRLYNKWDTAGTARYVKNAAAWLVNAERFGADVVAKKN